MKSRKKMILILVIIVMFNTGSYSFGMDIPTKLETSEPTTDKIIDIPTKLETPETDTEIGLPGSEDATGLQKEETSEQQTVQEALEQVQDNFGTVDKEDMEGTKPTPEKADPNKSKEESSETEHGGGGYRREPEQEESGSPVIDFDYQDYQPANQQGYDKAIDWAGSILGTLRNIGVIVAIIALMIIGVKYMIGSVEQKAQYKQTLIPLAIGILMLVAGTVLVSLIYEIFV